MHAIAEDTKIITIIKGKNIHTESHFWPHQCSKRSSKEERKGNRNIKEGYEDIPDDSSDVTTNKEVATDSSIDQQTKHAFGREK